ncbi:hypothetical protein [Pseudomonas syringae]|uniref:hypothetical protein n=1 Tax=Pseudomonas syringae TaxID=317 RepID=UPI003F74E007
MITGQPYLDAARTVLEGRHGFQCQLPQQREVYEQLASKVQQGGEGQMILVNGVPGCGITHCLESLARNYPKQCMMLESNFYTRPVSLTDRICDAISMLSDTEFYKEPPSWLIEHAKLTGVKTFIFDDLDKYIVGAKDIDRIMYEVSALRGRWNYFTVIITTRNMKLIRRYMKYNSPRQQDFWMEGTIAPNRLSSIGANFYQWNNDRFKLNIKWVLVMRQIEDGFDWQIDSVMRFLESSFVNKMLFELNYIPFSVLDGMSPEELHYELERALYE